MAPKPVTLRAAMIQAAHVLADEGRDLAARVRQARALLAAALDATAVVSPAERAALDADPGVQAALARLAAGGEMYLLTGQMAALRASRWSLGLTRARSAQRISRG